MRKKDKFKMSLVDMIENMQKEVGLSTTALCIRIGCEYRQWYNVNDSYCCEEIPYIRTIITISGHKPKLHKMTLCQKKILKYYEK